MDGSRKINGNDVTEMSTTPANTMPGSAGRSRALRQQRAGSKPLPQGKRQHKHTGWRWGCGWGWRPGRDGGALRRWAGLWTGEARERGGEGARGRHSRRHGPAPSGGGGPGNTPRPAAEAAGSGDARGPPLSGGLPGGSQLSVSVKSPTLLPQPRTARSPAARPVSDPICHPLPWAADPWGLALPRRQVPAKWGQQLQGKPWWRQPWLLGWPWGRATNSHQQGNAPIQPTCNPKAPETCQRLVCP